MMPTRKRNPLTFERAHELLEYDEDTGHLYWRESRGRVRAGQRAGSVAAREHRQVRVDGRFYLESRVAWLMMTGAWPTHEIDHKDCDPSNNAWSNLRAATRAQNCWKHKRKRGSGPGSRPGTFWSERYQRWAVMLFVNKKVHWLGYFDTEDEANAAREAAAQRLRGEYYRPPEGAQMHAG